MSESSKAVFLSYASQDAGAAQRICDALRAAGVEVWFDQSELVGGDAWDQKIRKQIKDCALLIPVISSSTQARHEGYFRLEWRLAEQRTHLMGRSKAFLLPVTIDGTTDAQADVPDSFVAVQWTKAPGGELPPAFAARVQKLLSGESSVAGVADPGDSSRHPRPGSAPPATANLPKWMRPILASAALVIAALGVTLFQKSNHGEPAAKAPAPPDAELAALRARIVPEQWQKEDFEALDPALDRYIQTHPESADAWALRSLINSLQVARNFDPGTRPLEAGKADAERALRLASQAPLPALAMGMHLVAMISRGGDADACRPWIDRAVAALPHDPLIRYSQGVSHWLAYDFAAAEPEMREWLAADPQAGFPKWIMAQLALVHRQPDECERFARDAARSEGITGIRARYTLFESSYYLRADLARSREALDQIPAGGKAVHRVVHARWLMAMDERRWDDALQELVRLPENFMFDRAFHGPKALLAGLAHARAGRAEAAHTQFAEAERLLREHLADDHDNEELHAVLAVTLACLGRADEARGELALVEPLVSGRPANVYRGSLVVPLAQARCILGDYGIMATWVRKLFAEYSAFSFTPASFSLDARFNASLAAPEVQALLKEFAALDQPAAGSTAKADEKSVAVLAFANLSDDKANEYFSDGISEELLTVLQQIPGLHVAARTSAFSFKGKNATAQEIGAKLGVATLVEGSVRKAGNSVRITARLSRAATGEQLWSESYTRELKDIFAVQSELAQTIVAQLRGQLDGGSLPGDIQAQVQAAEKGGTRNPEAHQLYLQGKYFVNRSNYDEAMKASALLQRAVDLDPHFALAWAALSNAGWIRGGYGDTRKDFDEGFALARKASDQAIALEPGLVAGYLARLDIQASTDFDWLGAKESLRRAQEIAPNDPEVIFRAAQLAYGFGQLEQGLKLIRQTVELDPVNASVYTNQGYMLMSATRFAEAEQAFRQLVSISPEAPWGHAGVSMSLVGRGEFDRAVTEARLQATGWSRLYVLALALWGKRQRADADQVLEQLIKESADVTAYQIACVYAYRGESDQAFAWLERAYRQRDPGLSWSKPDFFLRSLHTDPRWGVFMRKLGLTDDQLK